MKALLASLAAAGLLLAAAPALAAGPSFDQEIDALTARVQKLEGARAIRKLQRAFGFYVDRGLWQDAADLFAQDGTIEIGMDGVYVGKDRIRDYLKALHGGQEGLIYGQLNEWVTLQPVVDIAADGKSGKARWRDLGMLGQYKKHAEWRNGIYENDYVKGADGIWRIKSLHLFVDFVAPYEKGWARLKPGEGLAQSETAKKMPPDRPSTASYKPFPNQQVAPFHAPNPVTGKPVVTESAK
jgi:hypothetical protein